MNAHSPAEASSDRRPVLVVGASGQLGSRVVKRLAQRGETVRAFVRRTSQHQHLVQARVELALGDLTDAASIDAACRGVRAVFATANSVAPNHQAGPGGFAAVEDRGYAELIAACRRHGVEQFVLISVPVLPVDHKVPLFRYKRLIEQRLMASGVPYTILRAAPFMDDWFALIGSRIPARGDEAALIRRPWPFLQRFIGVVGHMIERRGIAMIPGSPAARHAFIAIDDVAEFMVCCLGHAPVINAVLDIGGPQVLSWQQVIDLYARVLGRPVRALSTPSVVFRALQVLMRPFSEAASNIMGLNWIIERDTLTDSDALARTLGIERLAAEPFLRAKVALPAD